MTRREPRLPEVDIRLPDKSSFLSCDGDRSAIADSLPCQTATANASDAWHAEARGNAGVPEEVQVGDLGVR
jgi:hypothetical protein